MKHLLSLMLSGLLCMSLEAIEGTYMGKGFDPYENKPYTTQVVNTKDGPVYQAKWMEEEGGEKSSFSGTGMKNGNQVSFIFKSTEETSDLSEGVQIYMIKSNDVLEGPFVFLGKNKVGTEKLTRK